jgi:CheY-like chemotaxis protein
MAAILIAEDDPDISSVLERIFRSAGFTVLTAPDGRAALEIAAAHLPDIVLTDLDMPEMNGIELIKAIRVHAELRDTPVALLSGSIHPGDTRAVSAAACGVLLKPFTSKHLVASMQALIERGHHAHDPSGSCPFLVAT